MKELPDIGICYLEDLPQEIVDDLVNTLTADGLVLKAESRPPEIYASLEFVVSSVIFAYLSKSYFDAFLKEAGKDHYILLKKGLVELLKKLFKNKEGNNYKKHSLIFSIHTQTNNNGSVKFVFPEGVSIEEYEVILEKFIHMMDMHYSDVPNDNLTVVFENTEKIGRTLYLEYSNKEECWQAIDWRADIKKKKDKKVSK